MGLQMQVLDTYQSLKPSQMLDFQTQFQKMEDRLWQKQ
ncbi:hypothetical protein NIES80_37300 [Dolichospermum planctonicum]|uniref:Uncharacterized protein n=1 Tax=Dolichospermum planctonicum TaxID=136072 RepID=A0A480AKX8_9CYAN|nr:hypothetical protein NIES80_37300 [Dolichospermum planctonicum]